MHISPDDKVPYNIMEELSFWVVQHRSCLCYATNFIADSILPGQKFPSDTGKQTTVRCLTKGQTGQDACSWTESRRQFLLTSDSIQKRP